MDDDAELSPSAAEDGDLQDVWDSWRPLTLSLACSVSAIWLFAWLSDEVFEDQLSHFDLGVRMDVHRLFSPGVTGFMQLMTFLGSITFLTTLFIATVAFWFVRGLNRLAAWLAVAVGGSVILDISLKLSFHRPRPVPFVGAVPSTYSFPSGHALSSFCFYGVLAGLICARIDSRAVRTLIWAASGALVLSIGLSRIYLGVHYPTDVIAGYIAAAAWVSTLLVAVYAHRHVRRRYPKIEESRPAP